MEDFKNAVDKNILFAALACVIALLSFFQKLYVSLQNKYADGWDAYFYLVQVKAIAETGKMHSPDISPVYPFILLIDFFTHDYLFAYKISAAVLAATFSLSLFFLASEVLSALNAGKSKFENPIASLTVLVFSVFSPSLFFTSAQFPKNMMGFIFFNGFLIFLLKITGTSKNRHLLFMKNYKYRFYRHLCRQENIKPSVSESPAVSNFEKNVLTDYKKYTANGILCLIFITAAFITHRFAGSLVFVVLALTAAVLTHKNKTFLMKFLFTGKVKEHLFFKNILHKYGFIFFCVIVFSSASVLILLSLLSPGTFSVSDFSRFSGTFQITPQFAPVSFLLLLGAGKFSFLWKAELYAFYLLFAITAIVFSLSLIKKNRNEKVSSSKKNEISAVMLLMFMMFVFPFYKIDEMGIGYRFYNAFMIYSPLLIVLIPEKYLNIRLKQWLSAIFLILSFYVAITFNFTKFNPPYRYYEELTFKTQSILKDKEYELVVVHKAFAEIFTYTFGIDALPWKPETRFDYAKVWRICHGVEAESMVKYAGCETGETFFNLNNEYSIIREDMWQKYILLLEYDRPAEFLKLQNWMNPYKTRPDFITKKRKYE